MTIRTRSPKRIAETQRWGKFARQLRQDYPTCQCQWNGECGLPTTEIHHIVPLSQARNLRFAVANLLPVNRHCHSRIHLQVAAARALGMLRAAWEVCEVCGAPGDRADRCLECGETA